MDTLIWSDGLIFSCPDPEAIKRIAGKKHSYLVLRAKLCTACMAREIPRFLSSLFETVCDHCYQLYGEVTRRAGLWNPEQPQRAPGRPVGSLELSWHLPHLEYQQAELNFVFSKARAAGITCWKERTPDQFGLPHFGPRPINLTPRPMEVVKWRELEDLELLPVSIDDRLRHFIDWYSTLYPDEYEEREWVFDQFDDLATWWQNYIVKSVRGQSVERSNRSRISYF